MAEVERKSKGIDPPRCKVCTKRHWGTCANQTTGGYLATTTMGKAQPDARPQAKQPGPSPVEEKLAMARAIIAKPPVTKRKGGRKRK